MTPIRHAFQSNVPDGPDEEVVRPSNWNASHDLSEHSLSEHSDVGSAVGNNGDILVRSNNQWNSQRTPWALVESRAATNTSSISFTNFPIGRRVYKIECAGILNQAYDFIFQFGAAGGGFSAYDFHVFEISSLSTNLFQNVFNNQTTGRLLRSTPAVGYPFHFELFFMKEQGRDFGTFHAETFVMSAGGPFSSSRQEVVGRFSSNTAVLNSITFISTSGRFDTTQTFFNLFAYRGN